MICEHASSSRSRAIRRNLMRSFLTDARHRHRRGRRGRRWSRSATARRDRCQQQISSLGNNLLMVTPGPARRARRRAARRRRAFKLADVDGDPASRSTACSAVAPTAQRRASRSCRERAELDAPPSPGRPTPISPPAAGPSRRAARSRRPRSGRAAAVCVIGQTVRANLFGAAKPVGEFACASSSSRCDVIGLLATRASAAMGRDQDDTSSIMPLRDRAAARHRQSAMSAAIMVAATDGASARRCSVEHPRR